MGASWRRLGAALLLVLVALAAAPPAHAGTAQDPEVTDPAGDQAIDRGSVPTFPGVNEANFDDVDLVSAYVTEFGNLTRIVVQTTAGWGSGTMTVGFTIAKGPTSLPASTATSAGTAFLLTLNGTHIDGVANATSATTPDGLRIDLPSKTIGATGGDLLTNLTLTTARTDPGNLQGVTQDDQSATDSAGPGKSYTFARPPVAARIRLEAIGPATVEPAGQTLPLAFRLSNDGLDPDTVTLTLDAGGLVASLPAGSTTQKVHLAPGAAQTVNVTLESLDDRRISPAGDHAITLQATSTLGGNAQAHITVHIAAAVAPPPATREVKPAGLDWLSKPAKSMGLDKAFGSYAEAFLLALLVLVVILVIFLLMALGRSTLADEGAQPAPFPDEAPPPLRAASAAGPAGLSETVRATTASRRPAPEDEAVVPADFEALMAAAQEMQEPVAPAAATPPPLPVAPAATRVRIEEVRHTPQEPEAGQGVSTEVILRNDGPSATLRITLSIDGKPAAERTVQVASHATKAVELPWTAGAGDNRVRIQAFPA
jgi:hypothetical protein